MKKIDIKRYLKILNIILILIWMITVFNFSNEKGEKSGETSRKVTETFVQTILKKNIEENETLIEKMDKVIRKLAHYTIYTIGGILIINYEYTTDKNKKKKVIYSVAFGTGYAVTDELHQFFVSERSARIFDVGIDSLGIITGVVIYLIIRKTIEKLKRKVII